jgi:predicted ATP-grasp superfamily ATP-dependent carboligase
MGRHREQDINKMHIHSNSTPVVVLGSSDHCSLGIARSLGRLGVSVYGVEPHLLAPSFFSRYCKGKFVWHTDRHTTQDTVAFIQNVSRSIGIRPILITTNDPATVFVAETSSYLRPWFLFPDQSVALTRGLSDKKQMYFLAKQHHIPTAETVFPTSRKDVVEFLDHALFPIMLKGIDGWRLWKRTGRKMFIVSNERELIQTYDACEDLEFPNLMIQEYIPGGDDTVWMFNGYFNPASECLMGLAGKKIRQCPVHTGSTSLGICLPNDEVEQTTKRFMKSVGYQGILDIGYRYDARDGKFKVLDVNPRIGATFRLFVDSNGMDVARALYLDLTGQTVPAINPCPGRKWMAEDLDLVSCYRYHRERQLTVTDWAHSLRGIDERAFLAKDDLLPILPLILRRSYELVRRILQGLLHAAQDILLGSSYQRVKPRLGFRKST